MNKIIIPTGYMGSGSSAITDLLSEYQGYDAVNGSFEYVFLHCPNGVFDLEDKLLVGNNALRSDEALDSFERAMKDLYDRKFWWPGNYKEKLSPRFMELTKAYIDSLTDFVLDYYWYEQEKLSVAGFLKMCLRKIFLIVSGGRIALKKPLTHEPMRVAILDREVFYKKTRRYLWEIFCEMGIESQNLILDQLLLPFHVNRMEHYFGENAECFVVERDPRDVYISNKYVWTGMDCPIPYPQDVWDFCGYYKKLRKIQQATKNPHVHKIQFEDLLYHYEASVAEMEGILGLLPKDHIRARELLNPERSIHNTQLFRREEYCEEMAVIEKELSDYLYEFPYEREIDMKKVF